MTCRRMGYTKDRMVTETFSVRVPATSANLGPGFDTLGMALTLYNTFTFRASPDDRHHVTGLDEPLDTTHPGDNLILEAAEQVAVQMGHDALPPLSVHVEAHIPQQRGLGSSASAAVGGLLGANALFSLGATRDQLLSIAYALEGHADNAAAALFGGVQCVTVERGNVGALDFRRAVPVAASLSDSLSLVACVPTLRSRTDIARKTLPKTVPFDSAAFSVNRLALLMIALVTGEAELLRFGLSDDLHQPYRWREVRGLTEGMAVALVAGAYGTCLSGSGSTLLSFCPNDAVAAVVGGALRSALEGNGTPVEAVHVLRMDTEGATVRAGE